MLLTIRIIFAVLSFVGLMLLAMEMDKHVGEQKDPFLAYCVGGISCLSILLGLCLGLIFG